MKLKLYLSLPFFIALSGCSVLSESQLDNINKFANYANSYADFPGKVVKESAELHFNNDILEASALTDTTGINISINKAKQQFEKGKAFAEKIDLSLQLIQKYSSLLIQLSSNTYSDDLGQNSKELSENLNKAVTLFNSKIPTKIPVSVGQSISNVVTIVGNRVIKNQQSKALKKIIPACDTLIQITANNIVDALTSDLKPLLEQYANDFKRDFNTIVFKRPEKINYNLLQFYIQTNSNFSKTDSLRKTSINAAIKLAASHLQLKNNITAKKSINETLSESKNFISEVKKLRETYNDLFKK